MAGFSKRWPSLLLILLLGGCLYPVREQVDSVVCDLAAHPLDTQMAQAEEQPKPMPPTTDKQSRQKTGSSPAPADPEHREASAPLPPGEGGEGRVTGQTQAPEKPPGQRPPKLAERVRLPEELPGARTQLPVPGPEL